MTDIAAVPPVDHTTRVLTEPVSSTAQAYETVRRAIIDAELRPGQVVSQVQLAAQLNISRTPLREALRRLQSEGLLEGDFNRRLRVAPLSVDDLEQLAAMRIMLETFAVRTSVPKLSVEDLERAAAAFDGMDLVWSTTGSPDEFRSHHRIFHTTLFSAVGDRMRIQLEDLWDQAERYRASYQQLANNVMMLASVAHDEHAAILESAQHGDGQLCGRLIASHLARTALTTVAKIDPTHDPVVIRDATTLASGREKTRQSPGG